MRKLFIVLFLLSISAACFGQAGDSLDNVTNETTVGIPNNFKLFPTKNYWTFLKLDTRNGKIWQIHFTVGDNGKREELLLNGRSLVLDGNEKKGRFTLYPTENLYNFLLLDRISGEVFQVQWAMEDSYRGIVPIVSN